jgi:hypothetical protein
LDCLPSLKSLCCLKPFLIAVECPAFRVNITPERIESIDGRRRDNDDHPRSSASSVPGVAGPGHWQWFAVRGGRVVESGPESLRRCYLSAPDLPQLTAKLGFQQYLDELTPQRLAEVWESIMLPEDAS